VHHRSTTTYGAVLEQHVRKARTCSDAWSDAINELAAKWLASGYVPELAHLGARGASCENVREWTRTATATPD
jgi:hypothetical protein